LIFTLKIKENEKFFIDEKTIEWKVMARVLSVGKGSILEQLLNQWRL
jgi:hypothetical protein